MRIKSFAVVVVFAIVAGCQSMSGQMSEEETFDSTAQTALVVMGLEFGSRNAALPTLVWQKLDAKTGEFTEQKSVQPHTNLGAHILLSGKQLRNEKHLLVFQISPGNQILTGINLATTSAVYEELDETVRFTAEAGKAHYIGRYFVEKISVGALFFRKIAESRPDELGEATKAMVKAGKVSA